MSFGNQQSNQSKKDKPEKGALFFVKNKKSDKSPSLSGNIVLSEELLKIAGNLIRDGKPAKLNLSAWENTSKKGTDYYGLKISEYKEQANQQKEDDGLPF